jgi:hypothetical protein
MGREPGNEPRASRFSNDFSRNPVEKTFLFPSGSGIQGHISLAPVETKGYKKILKLPDYPKNGYRRRDTGLQAGSPGKSQPAAGFFAPG